MNRPTSRFDALQFERVAAVNETGRMEIEFRDAEGKIQLVSLPVSAAVDLGCLICDVAEATPFLGAHRYRGASGVRSRNGA
jgi:hypothetical protein